jgi:RES domain-containing protein
VNLAACRALRRRPLSGTWYRALELQFLKTPLSTKHTKKYAGRYTPGSRVRKPFSVLYLCENQVLTLREVEAIYGALDPGRIVPDPHRAWAVINVAVELQAVVDLTDPAQLKLLDVSVAELTGVWDWYNRKNLLAPTQQLGLALFNVPQIEGFLSPSAKSPDEKNLNVFPANLRKGSHIRFRDPLAGKLRTLKGK